MGRKYYEKALVYYRQAIQINPNYFEAYYWSNITLIAMGPSRTREAMAMLEKAIQLNPLAEHILQGYILRLLWSNRRVEADRALEKLASISPARYAEMKGYRLSLGGEWANHLLGILDKTQIVAVSVDVPIPRTRIFAMIGLEEETIAISSPPHFSILTMLGHPQAALMLAEAQLAENPDAGPELGLALAGTGNYARARPFLEDAWQPEAGTCEEFLAETAN
jgi:tetratricopeptide (TPR) repeat protein